jgi:hypothetical protein
MTRVYKVTKENYYTKRPRVVRLMFTCIYDVAKPR